MGKIVPFRHTIRRHEGELRTWRIGQNWYTGVPITLSEQRPYLLHY